MKILLLPLLLTLLPISVLFSILWFLRKRQKIPNILKIVLGFVFMVLGIFTTLYAISISIEGMRDKNITCFTGVIVFIPLGLLIYGLGVPLLLSIYKRKPLKI